MFLHIVSYAKLLNFYRKNAAFVDISYFLFWGKTPYPKIFELKSRKHPVCYLL